MWPYNIFVCLKGTGRESCSHLRFYHRIISFGSRALELQTYGHSKDYQYGFWEMPLIFSFLTEMTLYENYVFTSKARISSVDLPLSPSEVRLPASKCKTSSRTNRNRLFAPQAVF